MRVPRGDEGAVDARDADASAAGGEAAAAPLEVKHPKTRSGGAVLYIQYVRLIKGQLS